MKIISMSKEESIASASLPGYEVPDVIQDAVARRDAKDKIFALVKCLFASTSNSEKIMESLNKRKKSSLKRRETISKLKQKLMLNIKSYEEKNNVLKAAYETAKNEIKSSIEKGLL